MKTIRFLETVVDQRYGLTYESGSVRSMEDGSAYHWIKRGKAEEAKEPESFIHSDVDLIENELSDGDTVEDSTDVEEQDDSDHGKRTEHVVQRRRGRPSKRT